jgi:hypothetical protein
MWSCARRNVPRFGGMRSSPLHVKLGSVQEVLACKEVSAEFPLYASLRAACCGEHRQQFGSCLCVLIG